MKNILLLLIVTFQLESFSQVESVKLECKNDVSCFSEMKNSTVHVLIKDFCDDTKPYKKILLENWKYSDLKFEYNPKYTNLFPMIDEMVEGEWYMFLNKTTRSLSANVNCLVTELVVAKLKKKGKVIMGSREFDYNAVINIPLFYPVHDKFSRHMDWGQDQNLTTTFPNIGNEFYFKNILQVIEQFVNNNISTLQQYQHKFPDCDAKEEIKKQTLYIPDYILRKASKKSADEIMYTDSIAYMKKFYSPYKIVTDAEIRRMFESKERFYYILRAETGFTIYNFILEGNTGKIINIGYSAGKSMDVIPMGEVYEIDLLPNRFCREYFKKK